MLRTNQPALAKIDLLQPNIHMLRIILSFRRNPVASIIHLTVIIEEQRGVNAWCIFQPYGVRPVSGRIGCCHIEIVLVFVIINISGNHIKDSFMVAERRCPNAHGGDSVIQIELGRTVQDMAELAPVDQILAVEDRNARKKLKA
ncbi:hypothetical protein D3C74_417070 [compost metagenome]